MVSSASSSASSSSSTFSLSMRRDLLEISSEREKFLTEERALQFRK